MTSSATRLAVLFLAIVLVSADTPPATAAEIRLAPTADTFVRIGRTVRNYGRRRRLSVSVRPERVAFLRFSIPSYKRGSR
jgi:hypothetical protein